jgi:hypothetical protein
MHDADCEQDGPFTDDCIDARRSIIRQSLDEIAAEVGTALRGAHLSVPLGLTVPRTGHAIVTIITPDDPSDDHWRQASEIVCHIVSKKLGGIGLRSRHLSCAMSNSK